MLLSEQQQAESRAMDDDVEQMDAGELKHEHRKLAKKLREIRELAATGSALRSTQTSWRSSTRAQLSTSGLLR